VRNELGFEIPGVNKAVSFWGSRGSVRFRAFFDYGQSYLEEEAAGGFSGMSIGSVGGGVRFRLARHLDGVVDYGIQLIGDDAETRGGSAVEDVDGRLHIYAQMRF